MRRSRLQVQEGEPRTAGSTVLGFQLPELAPHTRSRAPPVSWVPHLTHGEGLHTCPQGPSHPAPVPGAKGLPTARRGLKDDKIGAQGLALLIPAHTVESSGRNPLQIFTL
ncbi:uncharacterized protein LOC113921446 [Zalophus californianus]|uniref:Uncharacterized protein LOC113921446 n=1 Tax=Zalophus californianus TaxID=9704 RepID=A0A6J2D0M5_ZALCA|nr:uncharacterized protein LOC113921446 [Zalophus californianus]